MLVSSLLVTASVLGVRYQGGLQKWESQAYDQLMNSRSDSAPDSRLLIVEVTEEDLQLPQQQHKVGSLSNIALERLLEKLTQFQPRTIGLDVYREDEPIQPNQVSLATRLKTDDKILAICKVSDRTKNGCVAKTGASLVKVVFVLTALRHRYLIHEPQAPLRPLGSTGGTPARQWPFKWRHFQSDNIGAVCQVVLALSLILMIFWLVLINSSRISLA